MEEDAGPSTGCRTEIESGDSSFENEKFRVEFTNALLAANAIYREHHLITDQPPRESNAASLMMGEEISKVTMDLINGYFISMEEESILSYGSDVEQLFQKRTDDPTLDPEYAPNDYKDPPKEYISLEYKAKAVALAEAHPKWSLATLQRSGAHRLKRKDHLQRWKEDVKNGGTKIDKLRAIDSQPFERFQEARSFCRTSGNIQNKFLARNVTTRTLQQWATAAAFPFLSANFHFEASSTWVEVFKR